MAIMPPDKIIELCGGYPRAVDTIMEFGRALWSLTLADRQPLGETRRHTSEFKILDKGLLFSKLPLREDELFAIFFNNLQAKGHFLEIEGEKISLDLEIFQPFALVRALLTDVKDDHELRYFVMRSLRTKYHCVLSSETAHQFHLLAKATNSLLTSSPLLLGIDDIKDPVSLAIKIREASDSLSQCIWEHISPEAQQFLNQYDEPSESLRPLQRLLVAELNRLLDTNYFYDVLDSNRDRLSSKTSHLLGQLPKLRAEGKKIRDRKQMRGEVLRWFNRKLLEITYQEEIAQSPEQAYLKPGSAHGPQHIWNYEEEFLGYLSKVLEKDGCGPGDSERILNLFVESCREVGYLKAAYNSGCIDLRTIAIDAEYLLSNLFGMPTGIKGFDELFGGGGIMLMEGVNRRHSRTLGGRSLLIRGRFGTGKTLLSLQLALEVARKGGIAWIISLEQSVEECLYTLESMRALPDDESIIVAKNIDSANRVLEKKQGERGALIISGSIKESFDDFLATFAENAKKLQEYSLRLISIDPFNSIGRPKKDPTSIRTQVVKMLRGLKRSGTNVVIVAEEGADTTVTEDSIDSQNAPLFNFEENIADTVIRLSIKKRYEYAQRYFEVTKSRFQREQRGEHAFSIAPGSGITIFPSSAAIRARIRPRSVRRPDKRIQFGLPALDEILGEGAISAGDVIVLQGPGGSLKTPLGMLFLLGANRISNGPEGEDRSKRLKPILVAARDDEPTIRYLLEQDFLREPASKTKQKDDIKICPLLGGHVNPGYIFQRIKDAIDDVRLAGHKVDRVMIDNVAHWEMGCPAIRDDATFGDTLIDSLRRQRITSLLTCDKLSPDMPSVVQRPIIDGADCLIQFDHLEFRGTHRVIIKVLKTREMRHRRESFEIILGPKSIELKPSSSLLRIMQDGEVRPVKIRMFLHAETNMQEEYNRKLRSTLRAVLSRDIKVESRERLYMSSAMTLGSSSAVDELQILQIDEFQVPGPSEFSSQDLTLHNFSPLQWCGKEWGDVGTQGSGKNEKRRSENEREPRNFLPSLAKKVCQRDGSFFAVPFYENISLLAYRRKGLEEDGLDEEATASWCQLAKKCAKWENDHSANPKELFFDFPRSTDENYNCLFFEILLSLAQPPVRSGQCDLQKWLLDEATIKTTIDASKLFRRLCRRAHMAGNEYSLGLNSKRIIAVNPDAIVWRHWYTTLNEMMSGLGPKLRENIHVCPLPGGVAVAGEWYLGIPAYSAAPDVGLEIVKLLTSHEAELDRVRSGVGLPTRHKFYEAISSGFIDAGASPYFSMDVKDLKGLVYGAFRRSDFGCYSQISGILAYYLQRILEIPDGNTHEVEEKINNMFASMKARIKFVRSAQDCSKCRTSARPISLKGFTNTEA